MRVAVVGARQRNASSGGTRGKLLDAVSGRGLRLTRQRRAVLEVMERSKSHLDAATILERARALDPTVHKVTVYRTLETLKKHGLVDELDLMHVVGRRPLLRVARRDRPCPRRPACAVDVSRKSRLPTLERLKARIARDLDMSISVARFELGGVCRQLSSTVGLVRIGTGTLPRPRVVDFVRVWTGSHAERCWSG